METAVGNTKMAADIAITMLAATAYSRIENIYFRENYPPRTGETSDYNLLHCGLLAVMKREVDTIHPLAHKVSII